MNSLDEYNEGVIVPSNQLKLVLTKIDVKKKKNVFLHGDLEEKVYMDVLLGFCIRHGQIRCVNSKNSYMG